MTAGMYSARRLSRSTWLSVRGLRYHVRCWGDKSRPLLILLHGARDTSVTFQFVVDALRQDWLVLAPDWRGHGHTQWAPQAYWFHDFVADLDALIEALAPAAPVSLVGHSLGGNAAGIYASLRPERVRRLVSLDGLGPLTTRLPVDMPELLGMYLAQREPRSDAQGYGSIEEMAERLRRANDRLPPDKALFLAHHSSMLAEGRVRWLFDPCFRNSLTSFHSIDEWGACWRNITAPTLWVGCGDLGSGAPAAVPGEIERRLAFFRNIKFESVPETGHNLHHDEPETIATLIESFVGG